MKRLTVFILINLVVVLFAQSQSVPNSNELQLYLTGGVKLLHPKYFNHSANISPTVVPTIGGGGLWHVSNFQVGGEFTYTDGKKQTTEWGTIFTGINFNVLGGYQRNFNEKFNISIQAGFGYSLYHLSLTDKSYIGNANLNTAIYHNMMYTVPISVMLQKVFPNKTFIGIRAGYSFNVMPNEWRYIEGKSTETFPAGTDGLNFQLVFGGILKSNHT